MSFPKFTMEKKCPLDLKDGEKKFGWRKNFVVIVAVVVAALAIVSAVILLATFLLDSSSLKSNGSSQYTDNATILLGSLNFGINKSEETISMISQRLLPISQVYCLIRSCVVSCSAIPAASNPGIVAAVFVDSEYETLCPDDEDELIEELIFDNCRFTNDELTLGWLPTKFKIKKLSLKRCALTVINSDALNTRQFLQLKSLALIDNAISVFEKSLFDTLNNLEELVIADNAIRVAETDLLVGTANTLQVLRIDEAIYSVNILENIVGSSLLPRVVLLSLRGNYLQIISSDGFRGVPNVQSVYLTNSGISSVEANAFDHFSSSIRQLFLDRNSLSRLPNNIFQSIIQSNQNFKVTLANNDWNCCCDLEWLQNNRSIFADEPRCASPERNAMLDFSNANFCGEESTDEPVITKTQLVTESYTNATETTQSIDQKNETTEADSLLFTLTCDEVKETSTTFGRKLLSTKEMKFLSKFEGFFIREEANGTIYVSLPATQSAYTLIWFDYTDLKSASESLDLQNINCLTNVKESVHLGQLRRGISYTICLLGMYGKLEFPFNCLSFERASFFDYNKFVWLESKDKLAFFSGLAALLVLVSAVSVIGAYFVVWRNPKLLKGSKRIIMVQHHAADAIVLPKGLRLKSGKNEPQKQRDYVTPMSQRRLLTRKSSVISGASSRRSSNSYVSGIEPTTTELMSWRIGRIKELLSCSDPETCDSKPPPIPPPRTKSIPSLSFNVDEKREQVTHQDYRNPMTTSVNSDDNHYRRIDLFE